VDSAFVPETPIKADCGRCFALCCVAPAFARSAEFAIDKPAGRPCPNLVEFRCGIHDRLREEHFGGCAAYDCFGAGQQVAQVTFGGRDWRAHPEIAGQMFAAFGVMRQLHELLWYLAEALNLAPAAPVHAELLRAYRQTEELTRCGPDELTALDVNGHRAMVNPLLVRASRLARDPAGQDLAGRDLIGRDLRGADLRRASLRGALLLGADLRDADLRGADFTGADLRGADLREANLSGAIFLTRAQLDSARGAAQAGRPG
jgi:uncharacterized protein YjbI with pentapeptide repeats